MSTAAARRGPSIDALTVAEVVAEYRLPRSTVYALIKSGDWNEFTTKVGKTLVLRDGLELWIKQGGSRECPITSDVTKTRATSTHALRGRTGRAATGRAREKHPSEKLKELLSNGTPLKLRDIPSSRLSKRTDS